MNVSLIGSPAWNRYLVPAQPVLDLCFPILQGGTLAVDHGYALQVALGRVWPDLERIPGLGVHCVRGTLGANPGEMLLGGGAEVRLRLPEAAVSRAQRLAGAELEVDGHRLRLGEPLRRPLPPVSALWARTVTLHFRNPHPAAARAQLAIRFAQEFPWGSFRIYRPRQLRFEGRQLLGFEMAVRGLGPEPSLALQSRGFGGRRMLGCGLFVAF